LMTDEERIGAVIDEMRFIRLIQHCQRS
jgi:hypothetical protein